MAGSTWWMDHGPGVVCRHDRTVLARTSARLG